MARVVWCLTCRDFLGMRTTLIITFFELLRLMVLQLRSLAHPNNQLLNNISTNLCNLMRVCPTDFQFPSINISFFNLLGNRLLCLCIITLSVMSKIIQDVGCKLSDTAVLSLCYNDTGSYVHTQLYFVVF